MLLKRIVVAEDDDTVAHMVAATLGDAGFLCLRARDGEEALELVAREVPDLLVLDLMLPKRDGLQVARRLKADLLLSRIPILMLTALTQVEARVEGLEAGGDDYLAKPFDLRELVARVRALIRAARREGDRSPVTGLPGPLALEERVEDLLRRKQPFSLLSLEIHGFDALVGREGWTRGEKILSSLGEAAARQAQAEAGLFIAHLGGDDFAAVCPPGSARGLAERLAQSLPGAARGPTEGGVPALELVAAIVEVSGDRPLTLDDLSRQVAQSRQAAGRWVAGG